MSKMDMLELNLALFSSELPLSTRRLRRLVENEEVACRNGS
ncbi:hypothetical protein [Salinarchaeum sp. IM2453]|nr:hypothetical protein [Salinarchaeum sp. IM2453]